MVKANIRLQQSYMLLMNILTFCKTMPESLKFITSAFMRNKLIKNKEFCKLYESLEPLRVYSPERIKELQLTRLKNILLHTFQNVT